MIALLIYLISIVDTVTRIGFVLGILGTLAFVIFYFFKNYYERMKQSAESGKLSCLDQDDYNIALSGYKITKPLVFILIFSILCPSSKTIAAMYLVPKIIENKQVSELPEKMIKLLNVKVDDWISDLADEKKEEK